MPSILFRPSTIMSLLLLKLSIILSASSCGPVNAARAAYWLGWAAQESVFVIQRDMYSANFSFEAKPILQPVIAYVFETPSTTIVLSSIPGIEAILRNWPE